MWAKSRDDATGYRHWDGSKTLAQLDRIESAAEHRSVETSREQWTQRWRALVRDVADFPASGVRFRDITPLLHDIDALRAANDALAEAGRSLGTTLVAGIEARGFIFAVPVAERLGVPFVPLRKPGKLPGAYASVAYELEYGSAELQLHRDPSVAGQRVLIVDDVLATGGTAAAAVRLVRELGGEVAGCAFLIGLALEGQTRLDVPVVTLLEY